METKAGISLEIFSKGFNCAQAVLASHAGEYGVDPVTAKKIAAAFGGGMANNGEVCGAVTGALMLLGLRYGRYREDDNNSKENTNRISNKYICKFKEEYGSIKCKDLIKLDLSKEEELLQARESGVFKTICPALIKGSVELVEEVL